MEFCVGISVYQLKRFLRNIVIMHLAQILIQHYSKMETPVFRAVLNLHYQTIHVSPSVKWFNIKTQPHPNSFACNTALPYIG